MNVVRASILLVVLGLVGSCHNARVSAAGSKTLRFEADGAYRPNQQVAKRYFLRQIRDRYKIDLSLISTTVYWAKGVPCPKKGQSSGQPSLYHDVGRGSGMSCYSGLTFSCNEMYVIEKDSIGTSAFVHELGHCYHKHVFGEHDTEHSNTQWWSLINEVDQTLQSRDW